MTGKNKIIIAIATFSLLFVVLIIASIGSFTTPVSSQSLPQTEQACNVAGGQWTSIGFGSLERMICDIPTTDAGKICTDWDQCQGTCLADNQGTPPYKSYRYRESNNSKDNKGHCTERKTIFGCYNYLENSQIQSVCVD